MDVGKVGVSDSCPSNYDVFRSVIILPTNLSFYYKLEASIRNVNEDVRDTKSVYM